MSDDDFRDWDAAYVLGMLSPDDRHSYERHLATCDACSVALTELAGLPGILASLPVVEAVELAAAVPDTVSLSPATHQPGAVQRLAASSAARRRRSRRRMVGVSILAGATLAVGAFFVGATIAAPPGTPSAVAMTQLVGNTVTANMAITPKSWGTRLDWDCSYASSLATKSDLDYDLVVTERSGAQVVVASWSAYGERAKNLTASTSVATDDIRSVEIRLAGSAAALTRTTP